MAKKTEDGQEFASSAYLVVPDPAQPSTWKLRIEESPGKVTVAQLGRAAAALGPGFRGNKVSLSQTDRAAALRKLRGLYKSHDVAPDDLPSVLQQAVALVAGTRLRQNVAKLVDDPAALTEARKGEIREDLECLQESLYLYGLSAIQDGTLCYEAIIAAVQDAVNEIEDGDEMKGEDPRHQVVATFPGSVVYAGEDGGLYQCSYHLEGTEAVIEDDPIEVTAEFVPTPGGGEETTGQESREMALKESQDLIEAAPAGSIKHAKLNRVANTIEGTTLITAHSSNGVNRKRKYSDKALRQIAGMAEGIPAFANHVAPDLAFKPRDVRDLIGRHVNVRYEPSTGRVMSDLQLLDHQAPWVFSLAERLGDQVGNSLVSKGLVRMEGDTEVVDEIVALRSGDLVSDPASTKGLFEAEGADPIDAARARLTVEREIFEALAQIPGGTVTALLFPKALWESADLVKHWATSHGFQADVHPHGDVFRLTERDTAFPNRRTITLLKGTTPESPRVQAIVGFNTINQEASDMEFNAATIATHLKDNTDQQKQVAELLGFVPKADAAKLQESATKLQESATALDGTVKALTAERDTLKKRVDEYEAQDAIATKKTKLQEAIAAHDLGKQYGKVKEAVSEVFLGTLLEADEKDWGKHLDDRLALVKGAKPAGQSPRSGPKAETLAEGQGDPGDLHARLAAAATR